jgi:hypothetical protein
LSLEKVEGEGGVLTPPARARKLEIGHGDEGSRAMSGQGDGRSGDGTREQRLKAALRDNLRRRKAQARGREAVDEGPTGGEPAPEPPADRTSGDER